MCLLYAYVWYGEQELGFGKCKLCVQAPVKDAVKDAKELAGKRIVTSFPRLCKKFFDKHDSPDYPTSKTVSMSPTYVLSVSCISKYFRVYAWVYLYILWRGAMGRGRESSVPYPFMVPLKILLEKI